MGIASGLAELDQLITVLLAEVLSQNLLKLLLTDGVKLFDQQLDVSFSEIGFECRFELFVDSLALNRPCQHDKQIWADRTFQLLLDDYLLHRGKSDLASSLLSLVSPVALPPFIATVSLLGGTAITTYLGILFFFLLLALGARRVLALVVLTLVPAAVVISAAFVRLLARGVFVLSIEEGLDLLDTVCASFLLSRVQTTARLMLLLSRH